MKLLSLLLAILIVSPLVSAYQPRLAPSGDGTEASPYVIDDPAVSQIFYGELQGSPVYYKLTSDRPFSLFVQLLAPYANGYDADSHKMSVYVATESRMEVGLFYEDNYMWSVMHEPYGGDYYFAGPAIQRNVTNGTYTIRIFNRQNAGRYALAIGAEPSQDPLASILVLPVAKQQIFGYTILEDFAQFLGLAIIAGCASVLLAAGLVSKKSRENNRLIAAFYMKVHYVMWIGFLVAAAGWLAVYTRNTAGVFGGVKTLVLAVMLIHWLSYFLTSEWKIRRAVQKKALFTPKFLKHIMRGMIFQLILLAIVLLLTAIII